MSTSPTHSTLERRRETNGALWIALLLSVALHVPLLILVPGAVSSDEELERTEFNSADEFSVSFVEQDAKDETPEDEDEEQRGQFISAPAPETEERPDKARFRDQYDSTAKEEMVRRTPSSNPDSPSNPAPDQGGRARRTSDATSTTSPSIEQRKRTEEQMRRADDQRVEGEERRNETEEASEQEQARDGSPSDNAEAPEADKGVVEAAEDGDESQKKAIDPSELFPSYADASGLAGGGGSVDYMRDVPEGDKNLLNRKRSRYWSFMDRIKRQVVQQWSPVAEYRKRDPTGDVYGVKDKVSILGVTLNGDGTVRKIYVAHPSGLDFYDDEAVRAIRAAAPFPNPPEGMKDQDGQIHFNFMFVLSIDSGGGPLLRIRRR